jgi:3-deoxy-D-manno-octulosonic-acid transferase
VASIFNPKARLLIQGQHKLIQKISSAFATNSSPIIWIHCASLGEFEQGRPVLEALRKLYSSHKILLTFFSPSGYEVRKKYNQADWVFYLPWDTSKNASQFIETVNPVLSIFVKYEFWHYYSLELKKRNLPLISISTIFRKDQVFFKPYGNFYRGILEKFTHFFVQNDNSLKLLESIGIKSATLAGDTRFDRVKSLVEQGIEIELAKRFKADQKTFVIGSCWPEDLTVLIPFINKRSSSLKFIIAPHEITESVIANIEKDLTVSSVRFSQANNRLEDASVLIIDNIGMLSQLYRYGEFAYVGGAFGKGLHNILEPACYGIPIFFGNKSYKKFQEAVDLTNLGGAFIVNDFQDLSSKYEMANTPQTFLLACQVTQQYVEDHLGATKKIVDYCAYNLIKS